jgi:hypothetical protein
MRKPNFAILFAAIALTTIVLALIFYRDERIAVPVPPTAPAPPAKIYTLQERLDEIGPAARNRLVRKFQAANVQWPPAEATFVALKDQRIIELYARSLARPWRLVHRYPVLKASGVAGPKLRYGDYQVPEGIYRIEYLNPNSRFHVSLKLDYPNAFDREMGAKDGRDNLGGDIMIHGKAASVGCLAVGDEAAEELFVLAATIDIKNVTAIVAPTDFRAVPPGKVESGPPWLPRLYADIDRALKNFKAN